MSFFAKFSVNQAGKKPEIAREPEQIFFKIFPRDLEIIPRNPKIFPRDPKFLPRDANLSVRYQNPSAKYQVGWESDSQSPGFFPSLSSRRLMYRSRAL